jgi:YD repeat-containing protein
MLHASDPRGLTRTFDYDLLERLTQVAYPDGTAEDFSYALPASTGFNASTNILAVLDRVRSKDRLTNYWHTLPNRVRQTERIVEPSKTTPGATGTATTIDYCGCGSPTAVTRAVSTGAAKTTASEYNLHGGLKVLTLPDNTKITNQFDGLGRLSVRADTFMAVTNTYDGLGRSIPRQNGAGLVEGLAYDLRDRVIAYTNASGIWLTNQFDALGRVLVRGYPDGGKEQWSYTSGIAEATAYTNQLSQVTTRVYDAAQRLTAEVGTGIYTNSFAYSPANDLRTLTDGKNQVTAWGYDAEGRMTSKTNQVGAQVLTFAYDATRRLTNRWSAAKGATILYHDAVGSLTNVNYPASTDLTFQYDALNRLTNLMDAVGTSTFTYRPGGWLASETGPWSR